ncbi:hypothetical protein GUJ93_ZPchr0015g6714 [Zizania palustris]|uniref:Uncharacterized protein n=1 Tax=Zizania palustris TaxID=103762 RepID=A0A8J5SYW3_ZIZPA|nr:hypothetical protein GUJ93_ZPchr0015g6714 [Zizania palustris]
MGTPKPPSKKTTYKPKSPTTSRPHPDFPREMFVPSLVAEERTSSEVLVAEREASMPEVAVLEAAVSEAMVLEENGGDPG